jgi:hypothetical protein
VTGDERHNAFVAGLETGLALRCDMDIAAAEHEARHALVRPIVDALVADMSRRGPGDFAKFEESRRQHQLEALQHNRVAARPWPPETAPLSPHALFGQPTRQRVAT